MESLPTNPVLDFNKDQITLVRKQYNLDKLGEMDKAIDILEAWIAKQNHFMKKDFPRCVLEKFIIASKGSLERAKQRLDKICTFRTAMPTFFGDNLTNCKVDELDDNILCFVLPKPTEKNYRVFVVKIIGKSLTKDIFLTFYRYIIMIVEYALVYDYNDGIIVITDYSDTNMLEMIKALDLTDLRQFITIVTEGFGMRVKGIHLMTPSKAIETMVNILKQFLSPKLGKRLCIHKDTSTLFQYVPKDQFPMEYGGKGKSIEELRDYSKEEATKKAFLNYIEEISKAKTNESCRQTDEFNEQYFGIPGSFKTLTVD